MAKTVSVRIGRGSTSHNNRNFIAKNVDAERTKNNVVLCYDPIEKVYHELFDEAVKNYNAKQTRTDRMIRNYFEKIRTGKQEKVSHEVIIQIGNKDDTPANSPEGEQAKEMLEEYYSGFRERNKNFHVFSAHIHMDEATPHLHIDFVPFTTGSKRGLETRVSLKQALADLGFEGGTKRNTEWSLWANAEKKELEKIMEKHNIKRLENDEHGGHLDVYDFQCKMRKKEVKALDTELKGLKEEKETVEKDLLKIKRKEQELIKDENTYRTSEEYKLPKKIFSQSWKSYVEETVKPFIQKLIDIICSLIRMIKELKKEKHDLENDRNALKESREYYIKKNNELNKDAQKYKKLQDELGDNKVNEIIKKHDEKQRVIDERKMLQYGRDHNGYIR